MQGCSIFLGSQPLRTMRAAALAYLSTSYAVPPPPKGHPTNHTPSVTAESRSASALRPLPVFRHRPYACGYRKDSLDSWKKGTTTLHGQLQHVVVSAAQGLFLALSHSSEASLHILEASQLTLAGTMPIPRTHISRQCA